MEIGTYRGEKAMFIRWIFVCLTVFIVGFALFLWLPVDLAFRMPIIVAVITLCAVVVSEILKYVLSLEKQKVRGF